jgi:hypothetical protein
MQLTVQLPPIQLLAALGQGVLDDGQVDRVQDDDGVVHAQGGCGVDPVAVPAGSAQLGEHFGGVVAALGGDDDVARFKASMSYASCSVVSFFACAGALPPALEVEKNTGSIRSKSPSACMRSIRTEPTMPRQPTTYQLAHHITPFQM